MAFCPNCGSALDPEGKFCSKCGNSANAPQVTQSVQAPQKPKKSGMKPIIKIPLIIFACLMGIGLISSIVDQLNGNSTINSTINSTTTSIQAIRIDATALIKAYSDNQVAADQVYKGKTVIVTGTINSIQSDGTIYIDGGFLDTVFCDFPSSQLAGLASLKKGQLISVQGVCTGAGPIGGVFLDNCKLVG